MGGFIGIPERGCCLMLGRGYNNCIFDHPIDYRSFAKITVLYKNNDSTMIFDAKDFSIAGCTILDVIIVLVYYCQDVQLFHRANNKTPFSDANADHDDIMNSVMSLFTRFNWEIFAWATNFCALKDATAVVNQTLAMFFSPLVVTLLLVICVVWHFVIQRRESHLFINETRSGQIGQLLWHALFLTLLLTYQGHLIETASLVKCVPFEGDTILFLNGNVSCMKSWQHLVAIYMGLWMLPFWVILIFGPYLLGKEHVTLPKYILLCFIPLPMGIYLLVQTVSRKIKGTKRLESNNNLSLVARFLHNSQQQLPFVLKFLCCHGIIVMFRFAMVMMYTYYDDVMNGMLAMLGVVFAKLVYTTITLPYSHLRYVPEK